MMKQEANFENSGDQGHDFVLKLRGLPWTCTLGDVIDFFGGSESGIRNGTDGVHFVLTPEGRSSGEAFVEMNSEDDLNAGLKKDRNSMGHRYIEVFQVKRAEMDWILRRSRPPAPHSGGFQGGGGEFECECFVRLRGLPYDCTTQDIAQFFHGLEIASGGIQLVDDGSGRSTGEGYCQFTSKEMAEKALLRDRQNIGARYIELFRIGVAEMRSLNMFAPRNNSRSGYSNSRPGPYDRPPMNSNGNGRGGGRYGSQPRQGRYFSKGFEDDTWNSYANEGQPVGSWNRGNNPPPPPPPLLPDLKRGHGSGSGSGSGNAYCVLMRGLPYRATDDDIQAFFDPLVPRGIRIIFDDSNRPSGTAKVLFASQDDVNLAMSKNKNRMEHRYIELFVSSP